MSFFFFLACLPSAGPCIYITLGILGIILWASMDAECDDMYSETYGMLFVVFKIQVCCAPALRAIRGHSPDARKV